MRSRSSAKSTSPRSIASPSTLACTAAIKPCGSTTLPSPATRPRPPPSRRWHLQPDQHSWPCVLQRRNHRHRFHVVTAPRRPTTNTTKTNQRPSLRRRSFFVGRSRQRRVPRAPPVLPFSTNTRFNFKPVCISLPSNARRPCSMPFRQPKSAAAKNSCGNHPRNLILHPRCIPAALLRWPQDARSLKTYFHSRHRRYFAAEVARLARVPTPDHHRRASAQLKSGSFAVCVDANHRETTRERVITPSKMHFARVYWNPEPRAESSSKPPNNLRRHVGKRPTQNALVLESTSFCPRSFENAEQIDSHNGCHCWLAQQCYSFVTPLRFEPFFLHPSAATHPNSAHRASAFG